jgi:anti-sigma factor RsiW
MTCKELYDFLDAWVAGDLPGATRQRFQRHLDDCPACADYLDCYRKTIALGRGAVCGADAGPCGSLPDALVRAILESVRKR